jgi:hypothetical protein
LARAEGSYGEDVMRNAVKHLLLAGGLAACVAAQAQTQGKVVKPPEGGSYSDAGPTLNLDTGSAWRRDLEKAGIISHTGPFRVALPVASFGGDRGPKLMFTYVPHMKDDAGSKVFMLFMRFNLE